MNSDMFDKEKILPSLRELCETEEQAFNKIKELLGKEKAYVSNSELYKKLEQSSVLVDSDDSCETCKFSITPCDALSVRTASVLVTSKSISGRRESH